MITVFLHGVLAKQFGSEFKLDVKSPAEAVRALEANNPGKFKKAIVEYDYNILRGELEDGDDDSHDTLTFERETDIHFIPIIKGSKSSGVFQVVLGVALIVVAIATAGAAAGAAYGLMEGLAAGSLGATSIFGVTASSVAMFGAAMVLQGVSSMLTPIPEIPSGSVRESVDPRKSLTFTGAENVGTQGMPVPLVFGEFEVGSIVASRSLTVENL